MYLVHITAGNHIFDRSFFDTLPVAKFYASQKAKEKIWSLGDGQIYYGSVTSQIFEIDFKKTSDYRDEYILSFS